MIGFIGASMEHNHDFFAVAAYEAAEPCDDAVLAGSWVVTSGDRSRVGRTQKLRASILELYALHPGKTENLQPET